MENKKKYLTVGNVLNETFNLYINNFIELCMPFIIVVFPASLIIQFLTAKSVSITGASFGLSIISNVLSVTIGLYVIILSINCYTGKKEERSYSLKKVSKTFVPFFFLYLLTLLAIAGGVILLIIPGIIFATAWSVASIVFVTEDRGIIDSMSRSWNFTKGHRWTIFVSFFLVYLIIFIIMAIYLRISLGAFEGVDGFFDKMANLSLNPFNIKNIIYSFVLSFISPIYYSLGVVVYFNLKKEKESFDTEQLADSFLDESKDSPIE